MDPLTIPLALGCILTFSHVDHEMTEEDGRTPDGVLYKTVVLTDAQGRQRVVEDAAPGKGLSPGTLSHAGRSPDGLFASIPSRSLARRLVRQLCCSSTQLATIPETCASNQPRPVRPTVSCCATARQSVRRDTRDGQMDQPRGVRVLQRGNKYELGLPIDEARLANPDINE